jgi:hypothetical protein
MAENPLMSGEYRTTLAGATRKNPGQRISWIEGGWEGIGSGGMLDDVWLEAAKHCVLPSIPAEAIPGGWKITAGYDWGDSAPFAMIYAAISDGSSIAWGGRVYPFINGDILIFHEIYGCMPGQPNTGMRWSIDQQKRAFIEYELASGLRRQDPMSGRWLKAVRRGVADNQIFNPKLGDPNDSMAKEFEESILINGVRQSGIAWDAADKSGGSRKQGWAELRGRLSATIPGANGAREHEGLFITPDCTSWIETVPTLPRKVDTDGNFLEDVADRAESHLGDATRYLIRRDTAPEIIFSGSISEFNATRRRA